jgi:hypothetical protein
LGARLTTSPRVEIDLARMSDAVALRVMSLSVNDAAFALFDTFPKWSGNDMRTALEAIRGDVLSRADARALREAWTAVRKAAPMPEPSETSDDLRADVERRLRLAIEGGNGAEVERWVRSYAKLAGIPITPGDDTTGDGSDWSRLSEAESACLCALSRKLYGAALEGDDSWYVALLARVPARPTTKHPAHVPLPPDAARTPALLT